MATSKYGTGARDYRLQLALSQLQQPTGPVTSWAGGLNRVLQSMIGAYGLRKYGKEEELIKGKEDLALAKLAGQRDPRLATPEGLKMFQELPEDVRSSVATESLKGETYGTKPITGIDPNTGEQAFFMLGSRGGQKMLEGMQPIPEYETIDTGGSTIIRDKAELTKELGKARGILEFPNTPSPSALLGLQGRMATIDAANRRLGISQAGAERRLGISQAGAERRLRASQEGAERRQSQSIAAQKSASRTPAAPSGYRWSEDLSSLTPIEGGPATKPTEFQSKANLFSNRLEDANTVIGNLEGMVAGKNPLLAKVQSGLENTELGNTLIPSEVQEQKQSERNFLNAVLRRESGAVISPSEFEQASKQYFPRPGDDSGVLAQKEQNRRVVVESLKSESGPAYRRVAPEDFGGFSSLDDAALRNIDISGTTLEDKQQLLLELKRRVGRR